jgi:5-methylcytosine-specific restriction endonuclease McrA
MASHTHHILPRSTCPEGITEALNIIPLCDDCHGGFHDRYVTLYRSILHPEELAWVLAHADPVWFDEWYPEREMDLPY